LVAFGIYWQNWLEAVDALAARYQLLQAALDFAPDQISVKDPQGRYLLVNRTMRELLREEGRSDDVIGKRAEEVYAPEAAAAVRDADEMVVREKRAINLTIRRSDTPDNERWDLTTK